MIFPGMEYVLLLLGFVLLVFSGKYLVMGGVELASHLKISKMVVAVTVVSFGTSAPELIVSLKAALPSINAPMGHPEISIGNVVGSNIANIALILALTALIFPVPVSISSMKTDWPVMMVSSLLFYLFVLNFKLEWWEGVIFLLGIGAYIFYSVRKSRQNSKQDSESIQPPKLKLVVSLLLIVCSCIGLVYGAEWLVKGASQIASNFGVSDRIISVTVIAFGTSVPELATSVMAAIKKEMDISLGNIIGSNTFNILGILGVTSIVREIPVSELTVNFDLLWMMGIALLLFLTMFPLKNSVITRWKGAIMLAVYIIYIYLVIT